VCGIVGLHLRGDEVTGRLGGLLAEMLGQVRERGPDSAGIGIYGDVSLSKPDCSAVSVVAQEPEAGLAARLGPDVEVQALLDMRVVSAPMPVEQLLARVRAVLPEATVTSTGTELVVLKGVGNPVDLAEQFGLTGRAGYQGIGHTRLATESAVTTAHGHPFSVRPDLCLVHNGSFANHDTIRRRLVAEGISFDTDNDTEVGARFVGWRLDQGDDLEKALRLLCETFDGFYTLLVTTADEFAVVRDVVGCKPALIAETPGWVAMASEYRALAVLPGIERARVFEPNPEEVYLWSR
jgi:glutamate synthase domain-containing protein 1